MRLRNLELWSFLNQFNYLISFTFTFTEAIISEEPSMVFSLAGICTGAVKVTSCPTVIGGDNRTI